jgi:hypothetical protein
MPSKVKRGADLPPPTARNQDSCQIRHAASHPDIEIVVFKWCDLCPRRLLYSSAPLAWGRCAITGAIARISERR